MDTGSISGGYASLSVVSSVLCCLGEKSRSLGISVSHKRRDWGRGRELRGGRTIHGSLGNKRERELQT